MSRYRWRRRPKNIEPTNSSACLDLSPPRGEVANRVGCFPALRSRRCSARIARRHFRHSARAPLRYVTSQEATVARRHDILLSADKPDAICIYTH